MVSEVWEYFVNQAFCQPSPDFDWASLQCWTPHLPFCFCLRHHHWRRPLFPPWSDFHPPLSHFLFVQRQLPQTLASGQRKEDPKAALERVWRGGLTSQAFLLSLPGGMKNSQLWLSWCQERLWRSVRLQHHLLAGVVDLPGWGGGEAKPTHHKIHLLSRSGAGIWK